jgi:L-threonylcarbamoyladenylate synthase
MTAGPEEIAMAVARLRGGGVVAFPTETVYGLGADALSERAVRRVFELKGRPAGNPLIVHVSGEEMARSVAADWPREAAQLAAAFWPGPLTIVLPRRAEVPGVVTGGGDTVGVRCPEHPITLALLEAFGGPLVGPSANPSGRVSPTSAAHVREAFSEEDVFVLDGGPCRRGIESTVVVLGAQARVLRPGVVSAEEISRVLGREVLAAEHGVVEEGAAPSPGMRAVHYAPATRTVLFEGAPPVREGASVVVISHSGRQFAGAARRIAMPGDADRYAARLYAALREADAAGAGLIAVEAPPRDGAVWEAVWDRLLRATAGS